MEHEYISSIIKAYYLSPRFHANMYSSHSPLTTP